jgi:hypothetical protein
MRALSRPCAERACAGSRPCGPGTWLAARRARARGLDEDRPELAGAVDELLDLRWRFSAPPLLGGAIGELAVQVQIKGVERGLPADSDADQVSVVGETVFELDEGVTGCASRQVQLHFAGWMFPIQPRERKQVRRFAATYLSPPALPLS